MDVDRAVQTLAWPLVALVLFLTALFLFRRPVSDLIDRIRRMGYGDKTIDLGDSPQTAAEQQKKLEDPPAAGPIPNNPPPIPPQPSAAVAVMESEIEAGFKAANMPRELERSWLVRAVAVNRLARGHEANYRLITGSQLALLLQANTTAPPTMADARQFYEQAKASFPEWYRAFPFETWLNWPVNADLLKANGVGQAQVFRITPVGQDFLHYLVDNSLTAQKNG
jgi:hypothetical protein